LGLRIASHRSLRRRHVPALVAQFVEVFALHAHRLGESRPGQAEGRMNSSTKISPTVAGLRFVVGMVRIASPATMVVEIGAFRFAPP
jgi:hypothetical protein